ncbi:probable methyltransferase At1g29790 [Syzygium oleosum]|uniref:probable methyltransferase At1g29790 n=1 Tax=Syzygium oleosum TaxID=219896 RepID=UPI0011D2B250|nr:probable methyltransferase At1g29790 [Syzygium oleosum]
MKGESMSLFGDEEAEAEAGFTRGGQDSREMASDEDYAKKQASQNQQSRKFKVFMVALMIVANVLAVYIFTSWPSRLDLNQISRYTQHLSLPIPCDTAPLIEDLNFTRAQLYSTHSHIAELHQRLTSANALIESLLTELTRFNEQRRSSDDSSYRTDLFSATNMPEELRLAIGPHKLPLGHSPRVGSDVVLPPVGAACLMFKEELAQYMSYEVGAECPVDDALSQRLMVKGCEPLPRRRCHPKNPAGFAEPIPFPKSLWTTPPDNSIAWDAYQCKSYQCLIDRRDKPGIFDCKDCFHLEGREKHRWMFDNNNLDYGIDQVLVTRPPGTIRIGLDIGGGSGTFAARMRERNVTIVTTTMNYDGPFNNFIASRGLLSMHMTVAQRLPFFENTLDIVHSMHVLSNWIPDKMLEFTLYDIYRVLRPGGLFWLDHFFCLGPQLNGTYVPMIDRVGFKKVRWNAGRKLDRGGNEWYFSALLEKPRTQIS